MKKLIAIACVIATLTGCSQQIPCDDPEVIKSINSRITTTLDNRATLLARYFGGTPYEHRKSLEKISFDWYVQNESKSSPKILKQIYEEALIRADMSAQHAATGAEARYYENAYKMLSDPKSLMISTIGKPEMILKTKEGCNCRIVTNFSAITADYDTLDYKIIPNRRQLLIEYQTGLKDSRDNRLKITTENISVIEKK